MIMELMFKDFLEMVAIPSPSGKEKDICAYLVEKMKNLGFEVKTDKAGETCKSDGYNIYGLLKGDPAKKGVILSVHSDTVVPAAVQHPVIDGSVIRSDGNSVLGGDDKAGIAIIFDTIRALKEQKIGHGDIEVCISISEEVGLLGAKAFDVSWFKNKEMIIFDMTDMDKIGYASVGQKNFSFTIKGKAAHAGLEPEKGINAIVVAAAIIAKLPNGRIDFETTTSVGTIQGGMATNIVPEFVTFTGELRSHNKEKLDYYIQQILHTAWETIRDFKINDKGTWYYPELQYEIKTRYNPFCLPTDTPVINDLCKAGEALNRKQTLVKCNGGNDGNVFNEKGISGVVIGIGMNDVHSVKENIDYNDMKRVRDLMVEFFKLRS